MAWAEKPCKTVGALRGRRDRDSLFFMPTIMRLMDRVPGRGVEAAAPWQG